MPSDQDTTLASHRNLPVDTAMKHLLLITLVMFCYEPAYAGWVAVEKKYQTGDGKTVYFDPATINQGGTRATLWQLTDLKWNDITRFLSFKTLKEFDCEQARVRVLQVIEFSRQMGTGRQTSGYIENGNWQPVEGPSVNRALWKTACGKR